MAPIEFIKEYDIYNSGVKCDYTGLPIFDGKCSCFIHRKINERQTYNRMRDEYINFNPSVEKVNTLKKSSSHEILQIEPPVTEEDIKKAYHKLCLVHHPDKGGCNDQFIKINDAYQDLISC